MLQVAGATIRDVQAFAESGTTPIMLPGSMASDK